VEKSGLQNIQDAFLNTLRREKAIVTVNLLDGATLSGRLKSFDKFSVLLDSHGQEFLIFKHAIATVTFARREGQQRYESSSQRPPQENQP
jgi:host factor-I protein